MDFLKKNGVPVSDVRRNNWKQCFLIGKRNLVMFGWQSTRIKGSTKGKTASQRKKRASHATRSISTKRTYLIKFIKDKPQTQNGSDFIVAEAGIDEELRPISLGSLPPPSPQSSSVCPRRAAFRSTHRLLPCRSQPWCLWLSPSLLCLEVLLCISSVSSRSTRPSSRAISTDSCAHSEYRSYKIIFVTLTYDISYLILDVWEKTHKFYMK